MGARPPPAGSVVLDIERTESQVFLSLAKPAAIDEGEDDCGAEKDDAPDNRYYDPRYPLGRRVALRLRHCVVAHLDVEGDDGHPGRPDRRDPMKERYVRFEDSH